MKEEVKKYLEKQIYATTDPKNVLTNPMMCAKIRLLEKDGHFSLHLKFEMGNSG